MIQIQIYTHLEISTDDILEVESASKRSRSDGSGSSISVSRHTSPGMEVDEDLGATPFFAHNQGRDLTLENQCTQSGPPLSFDTCFGMVSAPHLPQFAALPDAGPGRRSNLEAAQCKSRLLESAHIK